MNGLLNLQWGKASSLIPFFRAVLFWLGMGILERLSVLHLFTLFASAASFLGVVVGGGNACGVDACSKLDRASGECLGAVCR